MARHEFEPTVFHVSLGSHEPALRVASGDTVRTWCVDASGYDRDGNDITEGGNPQTGPFFVEGAQPGDTLAVRSIASSRTAHAASAARSSRRTSSTRGSCGRARPREAARTGGRSTSSGGLRGCDNPPPGLESLGELPLDPMLGCFGVAPPARTGDLDGHLGGARRQHGLPRLPRRA